MNRTPIKGAPIVEPLRKTVLQPVSGVPYPLPDFSSRSNFIMSVIAPTGSGKSVLLSNLIRVFYFKQFNKIYFCSSNVTDEGRVYDNAYDSIKFEEERVFQDINDDVANYIKMDIEQDDDFDEKDYRALLIIDDLITSVANRRNKDLIKFILKSRHLKCSIIIVSHKWNMLPTVLRNNLTHVVFFRSKSKHELDTIYKDIIDLDEEKFKQVYEYATAEKHNFLYICAGENPQRYFKNFSEQLE